MSKENRVSIDPPPAFHPLSERRWRTESRFLFVRMATAAEAWRPDDDAEEKIELEFSAGRGGVYSATVDLIPSDYAREMAEAVAGTINEINRRWGLPQSAIDGTFTGNKEVAQ
ncbi:hypothetical protein Nham_3324 [Nitrobacter hamburgensis X14]|uniref:Uncharacterized protein n=1 Tax=Nitrobacter hamburgensis (strain DSM 10229 / NCIMB 13809 / X14) TaxID=323097 RepID=Q1QI91_NITHX|nr:hypothetical protein [Nitrobacter hamburgensis]ABE64056.1 hypothetical protein Nham_3324 [Nitrobacter hamburgensis X14]